MTDEEINTARNRVIANNVELMYYRLENIFNRGFSIGRASVLEETTNISDCHPVDEFKCSKCGIHIVDWSRADYDEDTDDTTLYEYEFRYCPNCGKRVVG